MVNKGVDSDMMALAQRLQEMQHEQPLSQDEIKTLRKVIKMLEAFATMGRLGKWLLAIAAGISALVLAGDQALAALRRAILGH